MTTSRDEIVRALMAEMRDRLERARPETRRDDDAAILLFSRTLAVMVASAQQAVPADPISEKTYSLRRTAAKMDSWIE